MTAAPTSRLCPVCGRDDAEAHPQKGELRLVHCRRCRMIYTNPVPAEFASGQYYDQDGADYYLSPAKVLIRICFFHRAMYSALRG